MPPPVTRDALNHAHKAARDAVAAATGVALARPMASQLDNFTSYFDRASERVSAAFEALGTDSAGVLAGPLLLHLRAVPVPYSGSVVGRRWATAHEAAVHFAHGLMARFHPDCGGPSDYDWQGPSAALVPLLDGEHAAAVGRLAEAETALGSAPTSKVKGKDINGQLHTLLDKKPECMTWSAVQLAMRLDCSDGTVKDTDCWKVRMKSARALYKADRMDHDRSRVGRR